MLHKHICRIILFILIATSFNTLEAGIVKGKLSDKVTGSSLSAITIRTEDSKYFTISGNNGEFSFKNIKAGKYTFVFSGMYIETTKYENAEVKDGEILIINLSIPAKELKFNDVVVYGASKRLEKITESPSSVVVKYPDEIDKSSRRGQLGAALFGEAGIDILQSGSSDFIVNTRGFNNGLNRRLLVLQDGRDAAMPLLGAQEWNSFSMPMNDYSRIELVKGPSAALYGANAFNGVLNLTSYSPKEVIGTKVSLLGGDYETFRGDIRHAEAYGNFSYKLNLGYAHNLNYATRRDSLKFLEYAGLPTEKHILTEDERKNFSYYGTLRMDYDFNADSRIVAEAGYSRSGNENYVFGLGRTLVKDVERPFVRLAYNSSNINVHLHYMLRSCPDTMWLMVPNAPLLDNSKDMMADFQHNFSISSDINVVWGVSEQIQLIRTFGTSIPNDVNAYYSSGYAQLDWKLASWLKFVASGRIDYASIHSTQFSPRASFVISASDEHQFRLSFGRAFQRPNYSELYRVTTDAPAFSPVTKKPIDFNALNKAVNDTLSKLSGTTQNVNLDLSAVRANAIGNDKLTVEKVLGFEFGYKGVLSKDLYVTFDAYYDRMNDFITNFLPGVNPNIQAWTPNLQGDMAQYNDLVKSIVYGAMNPRDRQRLSVYNGKPTFVVSNTNIGQIDQYGFEFEVHYNFNKNISLTGNYSYYDFKLIEGSQSQPLLPNTSPNRLNLGITYNEPKSWDAGLSFNYTEGFEWLAGTYFGNVPSYAIVNLNAGVYLANNLQLSINVFNLLDRHFYQIFGGTYLPRYTTVRISYEI